MIIKFMIVLRFFEGIWWIKKPNIFLDIEGVGVVTELVTLGDDLDWLRISLEAIIRIRRFHRSVCGAHGCPAPPPSMNLILIWIQINSLPVVSGKFNFKKLKMVTQTSC